MARETNANGDNFPGSFLSDLAEILSIVHQDGNKMITDALFLGEITILKQVNNRLPKDRSQRVTLSDQRAKVCRVWTFFPTSLTWISWR